MRRYTNEEALRRKWVEILASDKVTTKRRKKYNQLNQLLSDEAHFQEFQKEMYKLLSNRHGQGMWWKSPSADSILWKILKILGITPRNGSRLFKTLNDNKKLSVTDIIEVDKQNMQEISPAIIATLDEDNAFEEAMYSSPTDALVWLQQNIQALQETIDQSDTTTSSAKILERLSAFRCRLPEIEYLKLLKQTASANPKQALLHLHQQIKFHQTSTAYNFMETHCFAEVLLQQVLFPQNPNKTDPRHQRYQNAIKLLMILEKDLDNFVQFLGLHNQQQPIQYAISNFLEANVELNQKYLNLIQKNEFTTLKAADDYLFQPLVIKHIHKLLLDQIYFDYAVDFRRVNNERLSPRYNPIFPAKPERIWLNFGEDEKKVTAHGYGALAFRCIEKKVVSNCNSTSLSIIDEKLSFQQKHILTISSKLVSNYALSSSRWPSIETDWVNLLIAEIEKSVPGEGQLKLVQGFIERRNLSATKLPQDTVDWILMRIREHYEKNCADKDYVENLVEAISVKLTRNDILEDSTDVFGSEKGSALEAPQTDEPLDSEIFSRTRNF